MSSVSDFSPLRYRPTDPNMGRWAWKQDSGNHSIHWMAERDRTPVASITKQPSGCWKIDLTAESSPWLHAAAPKALSPSQPGLNADHPGPRAAASAAERALAALAISAGVAPDPAHIPLAFILGQTRSTNDFLKDLELQAQEYHPDTHPTGYLSKSKAENALTSPNQVAQARVLHSIFKMPKGHWPPRTDIVDDCIYLDSRYAPERIQRAQALAFQPEAAEQATLL